MKIQLFDDLEPKQYFIDDTGLIWVHGTLLCKRLGFSKPSEAIQMHTEEDERQQVETGKIGNLPWFVSEYGIWALILQAKTLEAQNFKQKLKREILPAIRNNGGYISPDATNEQLQSLQKQITDLQQQNSLLAQEHCYHELVNRFVVDNFIFKEGAYVMPNVVYDRFIYWYQNAELIDYLKVDGVPPLDKGRLFKELDRHFKTKQPKGSKKGFHFDPKNGFGDLENCQLVPKGKIGRFNHTTVYQLG